MIAVSVRGLDRVAHGLRALAGRVRDLSPAWRLIGARMVAAAKPLTPVKTARLVNTIKAKPGRTDLVLSAGGGGVVYAGVQNFGWAARNIRGRHFLEAGAARAETDAPREIESHLTRTARLAGLT